MFSLFPQTGDCFSDNQISFLIAAEPNPPHPQRDRMPGAPRVRSVLAAAKLKVTFIKSEEVLSVLERGGERGQYGR